MSDVLLRYCLLLFFSTTFRPNSGTVISNIYTFYLVGTLNRLFSIFSVVLRKCTILNITFLNYNRYVIILGVILRFYSICRYNFNYRQNHYLLVRTLFNCAIIRTLFLDTKMHLYFLRIFV